MYDNFEEGLGLCTIISKMFGVVMYDNLEAVLEVMYDNFKGILGLMYNNFDVWGSQLR